MTLLKRLRNLTALLAVMLCFLAIAVHAASVNVTISTGISGSYRGSNDLGTPVFTFNSSLQPQISLSPGTGTNQADLMFTDERTLAASGTENLDVAGVLADPLGGTLTFVTIKVVRICALSTNTNNVVVGGAASNTLLGIFADASDKINVKPGGCFVWVAPGVGAAVTASTGDILLVANSAGGTGVTYRVTIIGTSA
jgi:hypothetical protein